MIMDIKFIFGSLFFAVAVLSVSCFSRDLFVDHAEDSKQYIQESYMEDSFNDSTSSTETDDPGSGDESTEATSTPSTTTPTPTTTTTELTTTRPDREVPDITDETYNMELSLSFDNNCSVLVDGCGYLNKTIKDLLDEAFGNHTDDYNFQGTSIDRYNADEPEQFYTAGYTVVTYTANYDLASALNNGEVLIPAIETLVFPALKDKEINGSAIDGDYLDNTALDQLKVAGEQIELYSEDLCAWELANPENEICEFGQKCVTDPSYNESYGAVCENKCVSYLVNCDEDEGLCLINDAGNPQCSCKDNTLQISSGTCFHQNYLIFICAVGGGVLIIVVIVLVTVLLYRRRRPSNEEDRLSRVSAKDILYHERFEADEGQSFQANRPVRGGSVHSTSSAERVPRAGKSNEPPKHRHHRGHHNQAFDWDDKERIRLEELEDNKRKNDYDPYYTELLESESMKDFKPKLDHIDHDKVYAFRRPMFSSKAGEGSSQKIYESRWEDTD